MKCLWSFGLILFLLSNAPAQSRWCGSDLSRLSGKEQAAARAFSLSEYPPLPKSGAVDSVAVSIHIVNSRGPGSSVFTYAQVETEIAAVNRIYGGAGIFFFICGSPRYIDGSTVYDFASGDQLNRQAYIPNTINIYFVDDIVTSQGALCGYAQFPFTGSVESRYIFMNKSCASDGATLTHELGHFYGLFHTHETIFGIELVARSNCNTAGDRFCDTDADPNLGSPGFMNGCTFISQQKDPNGNMYTPPVSNFMSYAPASCQRFLSEQQKVVIRATHLKENAYLTGSCDFYPDFAITTDNDELSIRSDEDITATYTIQQFNTERGFHIALKIFLADTPDANGLLLHEERLILQPGESTFPISFDLDFPIAKGSGTYFLKAVIDAEDEIIERTESNNVAVRTIRVDNSSLEDVVFFPNPVTDKLKLFIRNPNASGGLKIHIYRYDGRLVWEQKGFKSQEEYFQLLDLSDLALGLYFITIDFEKVKANYSFKFFKR